MPTTTPNLGLTIPDDHQINWQGPADANYTIIDTFAGSVILKAPTATQTVLQPGSTFTEFNRPRVSGSPAALYFQNGSGTPWGSLSATAAATYTLDSSAPGDAGGALTAAILNAGTGFRLAGGAPANHLLVGNGTNYVDSATLPAGLAFYQTIQSAGSSLTQRHRLNFLSPLSAADNSGNDSSDISLLDSGVTPGAYTNANVTIDSKGRVTAASNGSALGVSATVNNVLGSRSFSTPYQNTSGGVMLVSGYGLTHGSTVGSVEARVGDVFPSITVFADTNNATTEGCACGFNFTVPNNWWYAVYPNTLTGGHGSAVYAVGCWVETILS